MKIRQRECAWQCVKKTAAVGNEERNTGREVARDRVQGNSCTDLQTSPFLHRKEGVGHAGLTSLPGVVCLERMLSLDWYSPPRPGTLCIRSENCKGVVNWMLVSWC